jgi:hypothetical protein
MLETFCAGSNFKSLLLQHYDMPIVEKYRVIIERAAKDRSRDTFAGIFTSPIDPPAPVSLITPKRRQREMALSDRGLKALTLMYQDYFGCAMPQAVTCHSSHIIGKVSFTTRVESNRNCNIFFRSTIDDAVAPGIIQYIVSIPSSSKIGKTDVFLVIERYAELPAEVASSPFSSHVEFGASLWSSKMMPTLEAVPMNHIICHAIFRPWVKGAILFKALDRVSTFNYSCFAWQLISFKAC